MGETMAVSGWHWDHDRVALGPCANVGTDIPLVLYRKEFRWTAEIKLIRARD